MSEAAEALDAALKDYMPGIDRAVRFVSIDQVDMLAEFYLRNRRAALAAYDAKREAALQELADLGQSWDAALSPAVKKAMIHYHERAALILSGPGADRDAKEQIEKHRKWADELRALAPAAVVIAENIAALAVRTNKGS